MHKVWRRFLCHKSTYKQIRNCKGLEHTHTKRKRWGEVNLSMFIIVVNLSLTVFNICFSLYMKKKNADLWWLNIPVAVFCFLTALFRIITMFI